MYYKRKEEYQFSMPREYKAYAAFKDRLNKMRIRYVDEGGNTTATISVNTNGRFDVDDKCDIWNLVKEEK